MASSSGRSTGDNSPLFDRQYAMIWDGECGFCRRAVDWFTRHDREQVFRALPFQDAPPGMLTPAQRQRAERAILVIAPDGRYRSAGRAVLFALQEIGWHPWLARLAQKKPLVWLVELGYWLVARNRPLLSKLLFRGRSGCESCR